MPRFRSLTALIAGTLLLGGLLPGDARAVDPANERLSVSTGGTQGDMASADPAVSDDGRFVVFASNATNLVSGDTNTTTDVFLRDRLLGTTTRVSVSSGGAQGDMFSNDPVISGDGSVVAFTSLATNLVSGDTNGTADVFVHHRTTGATERVSVKNDGTQTTTGGSACAALDHDGSAVAFCSPATDLVSGDTNASTDIFVRDRTANTTTLVSKASDGTLGNADARAATLSADGNLVAFGSAATNLVSGDTNAAHDAFVHDRATGQTTRVSTTAGGAQANGDSAMWAPVISADGRYVAFESGATNLVDGDTNGVVDMFRKDRTTGATVRASVASDETQGNAASGLDSDPAMSADGRFVAFDSQATNLITGDGNGLNDVFVRDVLAGETVRVSAGSDPNGVSASAALAGRAPLASFQSNASNLVDGDTNGVTDVFARYFRDDTGYFVLDDKGGIFTFGTASFKGSVPGLRNSGVTVGPANIVDLEVTPSGEGYYVLDDKGGIFTFGDAAFFGSVPGLRAADPSIGSAPVLDMAVTPSGQGYLILDQAGGIFTFGDATFHGSIPQLVNSGVQTGGAAGVDLSVTPSGKGYFILDDKGGIFTFGDAAFKGSVPGLKSGGAQIGDAPALRLAVTPSGQGYLVLDSAGGIFTFGDAEFFGSIPGLRASGVQIGNAEGVDLALTPTGKGYLILDDVGGIFTFGDGEFFGSVPALRNSGVVIGPNSSIRLDLDVSMVGG